jgi:hypothetical protein
MPGLDDDVAWTGVGSATPGAPVARARIALSEGVCLCERGDAADPEGGPRDGGREGGREDGRELGRECETEPTRTCEETEEERECVFVPPCRRPGERERAARREGGRLTALSLSGEEGSSRATKPNG